MLSFSSAISSESFWGSPPSLFFKSVVASVVLAIFVSLRVGVLVRILLEQRLPWDGDIDVPVRNFFLFRPRARAPPRSCRGRSKGCGRLPFQHARVVHRCRHGDNQQADVEADVQSSPSTSIRAAHLTAALRSAVPECIERSEVFLDRGPFRPYRRSIWMHVSPYFRGYNNNVV